MHHLRGPIYVRVHQPAHSPSQLRTGLPSPRPMRLSRLGAPRSSMLVQWGACRNTSRSSHAIRMCDGPRLSGVSPCFPDHATRLCASVLCGFRPSGSYIQRIAVLNRVLARVLCNHQVSIKDSNLVSCFRGVVHRDPVAWVLSIHPAADFMAHGNRETPIRRFRA